MFNSGGSLDKNPRKASITSKNSTLTRTSMRGVTLNKISKDFKALGRIKADREPDWVNDRWVASKARVNSFLRIRVLYRSRTAPGEFELELKI